MWDVYLESFFWPACTDIEMQILRYHTSDGITHYEYQLDAFVHLFDPLWNTRRKEIRRCLLHGNLVSFRCRHLIPIIFKATTIVFHFVKEMCLFAWRDYIRMCTLEESDQCFRARLPLTNDDALGKTPLLSWRPPLLEECVESMNFESQLEIIRVVSKRKDLLFSEQRTYSYCVQCSVAALWCEHQKSCI